MANSTLTTISPLHEPCHDWTRTGEDSTLRDKPEEVCPIHIPRSRDIIVRGFKAHGPALAEGDQKKSIESITLQRVLLAQYT